ncbi:hypothetical protein EDB85DRAFT_2001248, partial [Lactarius pseudohatsudake]
HGPKWERSFYIVLPVSDTSSVRVSSWNPYIMSDARGPSRSHRSLKQTNTSSHVLSSSEPGSVARLTLAPRQAHGDTAPCIARPGTRLVEACSNAAVSERANNDINVSDRDEERERQTGANPVLGSYAYRGTAAGIGGVLGGRGPPEPLFALPAFCWFCRALAR